MNFLRKLFGRSAKSDRASSEPLPPIRRPEIAEQTAEVDRLEQARDLNGLVALLRQPWSDQVRQRAIIALGNLDDDRAIAALVGLLGESSWVVRHGAGQALVKLGDRVLQPLLDSLQDPHLANEAALALGELRNTKAVQSIVSTMLRSSDPYYKQDAAKALVNLGDKSAIPPLLDELRIEPRKARKELAQALAALKWEPTTDEERALVFVAQDRFQDAAGLGFAATKPLLAALRSAVSEKDWDPCAGPAKALCQLAGGSLEGDEKDLASDDYRKRWAAVEHILRVVEGTEALGPRQDQLELGAAVGRAINITKRNFWAGLPWETDAARCSDGDWQTIPPGTYVLSKIEGQWVYIAQGSMQYKLDIGDFSAHWPDL